MSTLKESKKYQDVHLENSRPKLALLGWVVLILGLGSGMGIFFGPDAWFQTLAKPTWNPPGWLFGPVWTILYILMAISVWLVRKTPHASAADRALAMRLFWLQLVLNLAWTPIFFGMHNPLFAFVAICLLWITVISTSVAFSKLSTVASYLLVPYLLWISFALILNGTIWLLNA
jgi:translocator protein